MSRRVAGSAAWRFLALAAIVVGAACAGTIAPPPPTGPPGLVRQIRVAGHPVTIAARGARTLYEYGYTTKRFGSDSTWGYRSVAGISARLRYAGGGDSTSVSIELWGKCAPRVRCLQGDFNVIAEGLSTLEGPPM